MILNLKSLFAELKNPKSVERRDSFLLRVGKHSFHTGMFSDNIMRWLGL